MKRKSRIPVKTLLTAISDMASPFMVSLFAATLILAMSAASGSAAEISVSAEITSASIAFESKDTLMVRLVWEGEAFLYTIDDFPMPGLEKLQILGSSSSVSTEIDSTVETGEVTTRTFIYYLGPTDFGTGVILPLNLTAKNRITEEAHELKTGQLTVEIAKPVPPEVKTTGSIKLVWGIIIAVILIGGAGIIILIKHKRSKDTERPADRSYIEALEEIKKETVADRKLFYSRLYRLLLQFLEKERNLNISGKTAEEVVEVADAIEDEGERLKIIGWLNQMQKEKYRPDQSSSGDVENSYMAFRRFFEDKMQNK